MLFKEMTSEEMAELRYEDGRTEGLEQGIIQNQQEIVKKMLADKVPKDLVLKYTGIDKSELEKITKENN